jgi:hypothetical protein
MSSPPATNGDNGWNLKSLVQKMKDNIFAPVANFFCYERKAEKSAVILTTFFLIAWSFAFGCIFLSWGYRWYALSAISGIAFFSCLDTGSKRLAILYALVLSAGFVVIRVSDSPWAITYCSTKAYQLPASSPDGAIQLQHIQLTSCRRHFFTSNYSIGETKSDNHTYINLVESTHLDAETKLRSVLDRYAQAMDVLDRVIIKFQSLNEIYEHKIRDAKSKSSKSEKGLYVIFNLVSKLTEIVHDMDNTWSKFKDAGRSSAGSSERDMVVKAIKSGTEVVLEFVKNLEKEWGDQVDDTVQAKAVGTGTQPVLQDLEPANADASDRTSIDGGIGAEVA